MSTISDSEVSSSKLRAFAKRSLYNLNRFLYVPVYRLFLNRINMRRNRGRSPRCLEIGPGFKRISGFETFNVIGGRGTDYVGDAAGRLPFSDGTFDVVYASHVIEHIPWYRIENVVFEWCRILKPGGTLEVWTPDGLLIAKAFVEAEESGSIDFHKDNWWRFNEERDVCKWMAGRCYSYGDGTGALSHPNWHRSLFSFRYLKGIFEKVGLSDVRKMRPEEVRGYDHGWINLGIRGVKSSGNG